MFCIKCGKKVPDAALFCPYCGSPLEIPDVPDEPQQAAARPEFPDELSDGFEEKLEDLYVPAKTDDFVPLDAVIAPDRGEKPVPRSVSVDVPPPLPQKLTLSGATPNLSRGKPAKDAFDEFDQSDDIFLDAGDPEDDLSRTIRSYEYEEPEAGSFMLRHVRGLVGSALFVMLALILFIWMCTSGGQTALAKMNLAWTSSPYAALGRESFESGSYKAAGGFYAKAFTKAEDDAVLAYNAGVCYEKYGDKAKAREYYLLAINADSGNAMYYVSLRNLYEDASAIPEDVRSLLLEQYLKTGDARLKID